MTTINSRILIGTALALALVPVTAFAYSGDLNAQCHSQAGFITGEKVFQGTLTQIQSYGNCEIQYRQTDLQGGIQRIDQMQKVSSSTQQLLANNLSTVASGLATQQTTIDADTSTTTAFADTHAIFINFRVYLLQLPRTWIYAAADRILTVQGLLNSVETTLQTANSQASATIQQENAPFFSDMTSRLSDAATQAMNAENGIINLQPDQGSTTTQQTNKQALQTARSADGTGQSDLQQARSDAGKIKQNLGLN